MDDQIGLLNQLRKCYIRFIVLAGFHKHIVSEGSERTLHRARGYHHREGLPEGITIGSERLLPHGTDPNNS